MKRERDIITIDEYGNVAIPTDISATTMTEWELCNLFGITALAFRIGTYGAEQVRKALLERITHGRKEKTTVFVSLFTEGKPDSRWQA